MNQKINLWRARSRALSSIRNFFHRRDYLEVDTPILVKMPGTEVHLQYFSTEWTDQRQNTSCMYLRSSPEISLKKVYASGEHKVFQIAPSFRNSGEIGAWHHPEFTMLEWYHDASNHNLMIEETIELCRSVIESLNPYHKNSHIAQALENIQELSVKEAFKEFANIELTDNDPFLAEKCIAKGVISVKPTDTFEDSFFKTIIEKVEPELSKQGFVILKNYPKDLAALSRIENGWAQRFELYYQGIELCNSFVELMGREENSKRISHDNKKRESLGYQAPPIDNDFIELFHDGLPDCCGNALGVDRLIAISLGMKSIDEIVPFRNSLFKNPFKNG